MLPSACKCEMFPQSMSEFKYACPVCGQHIKCDSSQAGSQMECPTCFQKIIVPQAPTEDQKFIITGQKVGEQRPLPKNPDAGPVATVPAKSFSGIVVVLIIFIFIAAAVGFVYRGTIFKTSPAPPAPVPPTTQIAPTHSTNAVPPKKPATLAVAAPPSDDTNWMLNLRGITIPAATATGRILGLDFACQHATFSNGYLSLHDGDYSFGVSFSGAAPEALAGKSLNVGTNAAAAARVSIRWKVGDQTMRESFTNDYAMLLNFYPITNGWIGGNIYLCISDLKKSYVAGAFNAQIRKSR
jgi:DNA-directed RNA polymerase subunit RPC12/RpoP